MFYLMGYEEATDVITQDEYYNKHVTKFYLNNIIETNFGIKECLRSSVVSLEDLSEKVKNNFIVGIENSNNESIKNKLEKYIDKVGVIITDGTDNIGLPYTLGNNIIIPQRYHHPPGLLGYVNPHLMVHEAWHIISRNNEKIRDAAYSSLGFEKVDNLDIVENLKKLNLGEDEYFINPDSIRNNYIYYVGSGEYICPFLGKGMSSVCLVFDNKKEIKRLDSLSNFKMYQEEFNIGYNSSIEEVCAELFRAGVLGDKDLFLGVKNANKFYEAINLSVKDLEINKKNSKKFSNRP